MLNVQALANKKENRKGKVANAVSPIKSAAGKRTVSFLAVVPEIFLNFCLCRSRSLWRSPSSWRMWTRSGPSLAGRLTRLAPGWPPWTIWTGSTRECKAASQFFSPISRLSRALEEQGDMLSQLQLHVKTELGMHAIAGNTCLFILVSAHALSSLPSQVSSGMEDRHFHGAGPRPGQERARHGHLQTSCQGEGDDAARTYVSLACFFSCFICG